MAYTLDTVVPAGTAGLTDLRAQLYDTAGTNVGAAITTGFVDLGTGFYHWHYASFPDAHRGGVKFYSAAASSVILSAVAINPEEGENVDAKISTRSTYAGGAVASVTGNVGGNVAGSVASVTSGVTVTTNNDKTGYALSSAGIQAIWDALTSALTTANSIGKLIVDNLNATISSVKAKTDNLPASPAATGDIPGASSNASTLLATVLESGKTVAQAILDIWSKEVGRATANDADAPTSITYRSPDDTVQITHTHTTTTRTPS